MDKKLKKFYKDTADSVMVLFIIAVPMLILVMGIAININNAIYSKNELDAIAQTSTQTSIKAINSRGILGNSAVHKFVNEHRIQYAEIPLHKSNQCKKMEVNGVDRTLPYYEIWLETGRGQTGSSHSSGVWTVEGTGAIPYVSLGSEPYRVLSANVYTASSNPFGIFGLSPCQLHTSRVSAIAFGSRTDIGTGGIPTPEPTPEPTTPSVDLDAQSYEVEWNIYSNKHPNITINAPSGAEIVVTERPHFYLHTGEIKYPGTYSNTGTTVKFATSSADGCQVSEKFYLKYYFKDSSGNTGNLGVITINNTC